MNTKEAMTQTDQPMMQASQTMTQTTGIGNNTQTMSYTELMGTWSREIDRTFQRLD
jgi:hypothetical protein